MARERKSKGAKIDAPKAWGLVQVGKLDADAFASFSWVLAEKAVSGGKIRRVRIIRESDYQRLVKEKKHG